MSSAQNRFNTEITASDETAGGVSSADKRFKKLSKNTSRYAKESAAEIKRSGLGDTARTFSAVERAAARAFGSNSATARISERLGGVGQASRFAGGAMARAAAQGGVLSGALTGVGLAAAGMVGALVAGGVAGYAFVSKWANGGAQLGRLSRSINVATRDLQAFQGVAERDGVSKESMAGALGGIGSAVHAGIYGQNPEALAALNKLGIPIKRNADGTVDIKAMTLALADATSKIKDPYAQAHLASIFGFQEALPTMRRGGTAIRADMGDVERFGVMLSDQDVGKATRIQRKQVIQNQWIGRTGSQAAGLGAGVLESTTDNIIDAQRRFGDGAGIFDRTVTNRFVPAVERLARSANGAPATAGSRQSSGSVRRNNPGNIRPVSGVGFREFATADEGLARMSWQLRRYQNTYGLNTVRGVINKWAPPEDHNDTSAYVANVSRRTGFGPDQRLNLNDPATLAALQAAMIVQEHGRNPFSREQILANAGGAAAPQRHVHEFRGLPAGVSVTTRTEGSGGVSIGRAMPPGL